MPPVTEAISTAHLGDASEAVDKVESPPAHLQPRRILAPIDPDGDLFLDVTSRKDLTVRYRVCSAALRRHSSVWKTMLFGPWSEAKPTNGEEWVVQLPEDPYYAMNVVLNILHAKFNGVDRFGRVRPYDQLEVLRDVLVLTNKYDMTSIVRPWCAPWITVARGPKLSTEQYNKISTSEEYRFLYPPWAWDDKEDWDAKLSTDDMIRSLYVAWELGDEELFTQRLEDLSLRTRMNGEGLLSYTASGPLQEAVILNDEVHLGPQDALDMICAIREALLEILITPVHEDLDARMQANPYCMVGQTDYMRSLCNAATLGDIRQSMLKTKGSILPKSASEIEDSVLELADWLFPMMSEIPPVHGGRHLSYSDNPPEWECSVVSKYKKLCSSILDDIPEVVARFITQSHKEYMAAQRAKSGLVLQDKRSTRRYWSWDKYLYLSRTRRASGAFALG